MNYDKLLGQVARAGVYHLPADGREALIRGAEANGCVVFAVDLSGARDKAGLLETIGRTMAFPEWFGHNLDALLDCLADLGWRPGEGYLVLLDHCDGIHGRAEADFVATLQVFEAAAAEWREQGIAFWCFVDMQADGLAWLPRVP
ncbi:barstar family protein [Denitratisoma oestradiolicum]|uniref:Barstar (barnase inhibitor) domain-containing protein n=1 Tax=Denitratisoma oestradiolicum TaxID=311182 RepID=A0A6S6XXA6_9PROT|nr:barstar family protein [Denitratisoma oestradiolicum]TWO79716.1 hypothetical protein CBW56_13305 [Denitratisoma oestradiolicum]CAB1367479.1 conserved protein of unknown function [Denitratisoma oestradiolicum]